MPETEGSRTEAMTIDATAIAVLSVLFLSALSRSTFGFGDALIAMPPLTMLIGIKMAAPLVALMSATIAASIVFQDWRRIHVKSAAWLIASSFVGIPVGLVFLTRVDEQTVKVVLAVLIIGFSTYSLLKPRLFAVATDKSACLFGFAAGVFGGAYNVHGPPLVIYGTLRQWSAEHFRATLQGYFLPASLLVLCGHGLAGLWNPILFLYFGLSIPGVLFGIVLGRKLNQRLNHRLFLRYVYVFLAIIGAALLVESIRG